MSHHRRQRQVTEQGADDRGQPPRLASIRPPHDSLEIDRILLTHMLMAHAIHSASASADLFIHSSGEKFSSVAHHAHEHSFAQTRGREAILPGP